MSICHLLDGTCMPLRDRDAATRDMSRRIMPHYFFDIHDGMTVRDKEGLELPDVSAVRAVAHWALAELATQQSHETGAIQIRADLRDTHGEHVLSATLLLVSEAAADEPSGV